VEEGVKGNHYACWTAACLALVLESMQYSFVSLWFVSYFYPY